MNIERTNLLPPARIKMVHRIYFLRLATVAVLLSALLVVVQGALLLPSYLYLGAKENSEETELSHINATSQANGEKSVQDQLNTLESEASYLAKLDKNSSASATVRALLAVPHTGITLDSFTFTSASDGNPANVELMGTASTRETLQDYDTALSQLSFVKSANLPISDFAQESNIPFTVTITGALTP